MAVSLPVVVRSSGLAAYPAGGGGGTGSQEEELRGGFEGVGEGVDVPLVVVQVQRRPGGGAHPQLAHEGLGAMVPGPDAHGVLVEDLGDVVGVQALEGEGDRPAAVEGVRG